MTIKILPWIFGESARRVQTRSIVDPMRSSAAGTGRESTDGWKSFGGLRRIACCWGRPDCDGQCDLRQVTESLPDKIKDYPPPAMLIDGARVGLGIYRTSRFSTGAIQAHRLRELAQWRIRKGRALGRVRAESALENRARGSKGSVGKAKREML